MGVNEKGDRDQIQLNRVLSLGQIAAGIAHEVKNPLTSVKGFLQLLHEKYPDEYIGIAESELDNALSILVNFLQVAKPDMDNEPYQVVNLAFELDSILNLFLDRVYKIQVTKDFKDTNMTVYGKKNQLKRAFFNLVKNAFESIPDTGTIEVRHYAEENQLVIVIADTGIGMDEEMLSLLGTPFLTTKDEGTGMGLSQVYSTIYQHGGHIRVESTKGEGSRFYVFIPIESQGETVLNELSLIYEDNFTLNEFMEANRNHFREYLLLGRSELAATVEEIKEQSGVNLVQNAVNLVELALNDYPHQLATFAKSEGQLWAKHSLQVSFKLEWLQTIKAVLWAFIYNYFRMQNERGKLEDLETFFKLERKINSALDSFLNHFTLSYNQFKDEILQTQRELVENLSVPIIPLTSTVSILPLIGTIDTFRAATVQEKVFHEIEMSRIETMIIDLSGVSFLDTAVLNHLFHLFEGIELMGCQTIVTGIRAEIASALVKAGLSLGSKTIKKSSLQHALELIDLTK